MKTTSFTRKLSLILCIVLIAAIALTCTGCNDKNPADLSTSVSEEVAAGKTVLGEGAVKFTFTVTDAEGKETVFEINTDKKTVGDALLEHGLIAGDEGDFGLYVKTVNGITVDYDKDGKYWAFYVDGKYASAGVDATDVTAGASYALKVE